MNVLLNCYLIGCIFSFFFFGFNEFEGFDVSFRVVLFSEKDLRGNIQLELGGDMDSTSKKTCCKENR